MQVKSDCAPGNASIRRWSNWEKKKKSAAFQVIKERKIMREQWSLQALEATQGRKELCWASCCDNLELVGNTVPCSPLLLSSASFGAWLPFIPSGMCCLGGGCHPTSCF